MNITDEKAKRIDEAFPREETFIDCAGAPRKFYITMVPLEHGDGYHINAEEIVDDDCGGGYQFEIFSEGYPFWALGDLRAKIKKGLATRYLRKGTHGLSMTHDTIKGRIASAGFVIDGTFYEYDEILGIMSNHEGFDISITITNSDGVTTK